MIPGRVGRAPSFQCTCPLGFTNTLCETPVSNACDTFPCRNGGSCLLSTLNTFQCACPIGWTGDNCTEVRNAVTCHGCVHDPLLLKVDHCATNPCRNGAECVSLAESYRCKCKPGFKGPSCDLNINECYELTNPCQHGRCQDTYGGYK